ncbi:hypothetical protein LMH87_001429 [Akanthomyces muscarius]|uniref:Uncharacterized protein n=1 Tax=Akanthomyces muscarius TaxID=2231603 RepID=A0A9W8Q6A9_AKAMU|nr:hypothetical protein LMH87_001429 [Akanthomyces muscarius]KAJ4146870.1 hypothetical protein LMH87_001429 [Akanthomyces muscarius]
MQHERDFSAAGLQLLFKAEDPSVHCSTGHTESQLAPSDTANSQQKNDRGYSRHNAYGQTYTNTSDDVYCDVSARTPRHWWLIFHDKYELFPLILVLVNAIPVVLVGAYTSKLAEQLASYSCLPNGDFVIPGKGSLWDKKLFFTVDILVSKDAGWSFTHAKVVDIAWDTVVGRGAQLLLAYMAYHVFHKALVQVMVERQVGFPTYGAVAFDTGKVSSLWAFLQALTSRAFPLTSHGRRVFTAMFVCTAYIASIPTLLSAMTGYVAVYSPSIEMPPTLTAPGEPAALESDWDCARQGNCSITPCWSTPSPDGLLAAWGTVHDQNRKNSPIQSLLMPVPIRYKDTSNVVAYYERYKADYNAAAKDPRCQNSTTGLNVTMLTDCGPLNKTSEIRDSLNSAGSSSRMIKLDAPMLNIEVWPFDEATNMPSAWLCNDLIIKTADLNSHKNVTGICTSVNSNYQWGFSYLILLIVCILHLLFAVIMYALWLEARRCSVDAISAWRRTPLRCGADDASLKTQDLVRKAAARPSIMTSAIAIVSQAEQHYGANVSSWTNSKLNKRVWRGSKGMQAR